MITFSHSIGKNEASVPVPRTSSLRGLNIRFIPPLPKELPYMASNGNVVIFLSASNFGRGYHSRYQNFEFTGCNLHKTQASCIKDTKCVLVWGGAILEQDMLGRPTQMVKLVFNLSQDSCKSQLILSCIHNTIVQ